MSRSIDFDHSYHLISPSSIPISSYHPPRELILLEFLGRFLYFYIYHIIFILSSTHFKHFKGIWNGFFGIFFENCDHCQFHPMDDLRGRTVTAPWIWLGGRFRRGVRIRVDADGRIAAVEADDEDKSEQYPEEQGGQAVHELADLVRKIHLLVLEVIKKPPLKKSTIWPSPKNVLATTNKPNV